MTGNVSKANGSSRTSDKPKMIAKGLLPVLLVVLTLFTFIQTGATDFFKSNFPPVEELTYQRVAFPTAGQLLVHLDNGGPEAAGRAAGKPREHESGKSTPEMHT